MDLPIFMALAVIPLGIFTEALVDYVEGVLKRNGLLKPPDDGTLP